MLTNGSYYHWCYVKHQCWCGVARFILRELVSQFFLATDIEMMHCDGPAHLFHMHPSVLIDIILNYGHFCVAGYSHSKQEVRVQLIILSKVLKALSTVRRVSVEGPQDHVYGG